MPMQRVCPMPQQCLLSSTVHQGMDQAKFRLPRNIAMTKDAAPANGPNIRCVVVFYSKCALALRSEQRVETLLDSENRRFWGTLWAVSLQEFEKMWRPTEHLVGCFSRCPRRHSDAEPRVLVNTFYQQLCFLGGEGWPCRPTSKKYQRRIASLASLDQRWMSRRLAATQGFTECRPVHPAIEISLPERRLTSRFGAALIAFTMIADRDSAPSGRGRRPRRQ